MCRRFAASALFLSSAAICGCHQFGPGTIKAARVSYNEVINRTSNEQMLLNLVRLKYRDTPFFLEISSVSNSYNFGASLSATGVATGGPYLTGTGPGLSYAERPSISYTPLQGDKFVKQLLQPLSLETLVLMYHSGWSVERVFNCCVQRLNGVKNAPSASGPTPSYLPAYRDFKSAVKIMRELQKTGGMEVGAESGDGGSVLVVTIAEDVSDSDEVNEFRRLLRLAADTDVYRLTTDLTGAMKGNIGVSTRSLMGVLFYLSQSVQVPDAHEFLGNVTVTQDESGQPFDWDKVTGDVMRVRWSRSEPGDAAVAVPYRGVWFHIEDSDLNSKSTFSLLSQLFMLQAGSVKMQMPLLTLPVGGGASGVAAK
jgi:hypothetical protein